jgi:hypothetical protein
MPFITTLRRLNVRLQELIPDVPTSVPVRESNHYLEAKTQDNHQREKKPNSVKDPTGK